MLLLAATIVLPLVLESSPPGKRVAVEPAPADREEPSPDRIRITSFDGGAEPLPSPGTAEPPAAPSGSSDRLRDDSADVPPLAGWAVQIGSFADPANAEKLKKQVASRGYRVVTESVTTNEGSARVRVLVGPDRTRAAAAGRLSRLRREDSIDGFLVRYPG